MERDEAISRQHEREREREKKKTLTETGIERRADTKQTNSARGDRLCFPRLQAVATRSSGITRYTGQLEKARRRHINRNKL